MHLREQINLPCVCEAQSEQGQQTAAELTPSLHPGWIILHQLLELKVAA
jgi:hypothetical protein